MSTVDDYFAIVHVAYRYAQAADRHDWQSLADCFTEDASADFNNTIVEGRGAIIQWCRSRLEEWEATQHFTGNPVVKIDGDRADASFYVIAQHSAFRHGDLVTCLAGGVYEDELARCPDGWRFFRRRVRKLWMIGDESLLPAAVYGANEIQKMKPLPW